MVQVRSVLRQIKIEEIDKIEEWREFQCLYYSNICA